MNKELPRAYEPSLYEDDIYKKWLESGFFQPKVDQPLVGDSQAMDEKKSYCIVMPPPNVTGNLHIGHAVMLAVQDILIRYHRMKGERTLWVPGTDHAAIATQTKVEKLLKEKGVDRHKLGREKFLKEVEKFANNSHDTIVNQIKKMGSSCDWSREAYTLDETRSRAVQSVFKMMHDDGLIYRGERIVNWCPRCESTLADDEIEYKTQITKFYTFRYAKNFPIAISTTRPETKLGDTAVAVNPSDNRYKKFIGRVFEIDFVGIKINLKIIADRNVDMNFGTGALGVTPAHSMADWQMSQENDLPVIKVIDETGKIRPGFNEFSGLKVKAAREMIVEKLKAGGLLEKEEEIENNLSLCYRCDTPIEPLPSLQWFIDVNKKIPKYAKTIKELAIDAVKKGVFQREKIKIIPERFEKNYFHWMDNLRDWCVSRQIWFGHRVPVWYKKSKNSDDKEIFVGVEPPAGEGWVQDSDTLDTWFSSGLWTFSTLAKNANEIKFEGGQLKIDSDDFKNFHPTDVLETAYDILFFWVARMIIMTTYVVGDIPFKNVYLHGLVLDEKGKKMSKSKGNVIDPLDMIKKYGTDATRLSLVIGSTPGNDTRLSEEKIGGYKNFVNKLWNISRFIITNYEMPRSSDQQITTANAGPANYEIDNGKLTIADKWILDKIKNLINDVTDDLDNYRFSQAGEKLKSFTWDDLADWYLEVSKFETDGEKSNILSFILTNILKLWHPFIPFVTEKIWEILGYESLIISKWPAFASSYAKASADKDAMAGKPSDVKITNGQPDNDFEIIKNIIIAIRNARSEHKIEPAKKIKAVICAGKHKAMIESQSILIKSLRTSISDLEILEKNKKIDQAIYITVGKIEIYLISEIDKEKEKIRIKKEIENLEKIIIRLENKVNDKEFISKAPENIVAKEKEKLEKYRSELDKLVAKMNIADL
jgi:valyl-tRNA synthetase